MLSNRLQLIADMVPACEVMADIGTDHGYLPIDLVQSGKVGKAYAMDINKGPLAKADANIQDADLQSRVTTMLSDGMAHLPEDVQVVVIAGMGGMLIGSILESEQKKLNQLSHLVLSPHLHVVEMRKKVHALHWCIAKEHMVEDAEKYYTVMTCEPRTESYSQIEYQYGRQLMILRDPVWLKYMAFKYEKLKKIAMGLRNKNTENTRTRLLEIEAELREIEEVTQYEA